MTEGEGKQRMSRRGPLFTLAAVVVLAIVFLWANTLVPKPGATSAAVNPASAPTSTATSTGTSTGTSSPTSTATPVSTASPSTSTPPLHALYTGRSSGDQVTVALAINGGKAAADLNAGQASEVSLQGSVHGSLVTLTAANGVGITGSLSGSDLFGIVTGFLGQSFPFSAAQTAVQAVYAGRSSGNEVTLAIATDGDQAAAYVCNGKTIEAWLQGSVHGNQVTLSGNKGASLTGTLSGLAMFGMVTPAAGVNLPFSAELSARPAGVFQARITVNGLATRIGWAVLPDGTQLGVAVTGTTKTPAPPLNLSDDSFTLNGTTFTASSVAGDATVVTP
jgi:hypothetical protein